MSTFSPRLTVAVLLVALLGSCTNIKDDGKRTRTEGALGGAVLGALAGAGIGALTGRGTGAILAGAAAGAAVGGAGGYAYGSHVARKKNAYASKEAWLNACIAEARSANRKARAYNASLSNKIDRLRAEVSRAKASGDKGLLRQKKSEIQQLQKENSKELKQLDGQINEQQKVLSQESSPTLKQEVISLRNTRGTMSSNYDRLASLNREIDV